MSRTGNTRILEEDSRKASYVGIEELCPMIEICLYARMQSVAEEFCSNTEKYTSCPQNTGDK